MNTLSLAGIPGTISAEAGCIRWIHRRDTKDPATGTLCRVYEAVLIDGLLVALLSQDEVSPGRKLWHLSVSHRDADNRPDRVPSWDELKSAAYRLVQADVPMVLIFPRRSTPKEMYVNVYETCLHLWEAEGDVDQ
jgi:hypothetical protein